MKKSLIALAVVSGLSAPAVADHAYDNANVSYSGHGHGASHNLRPFQETARPSTFSVNYLEAGYAATDYDKDLIDDESDGFYVQGRKSLTEHVYVHGFYTDQSMDDADIDGDAYNLGLGAHKPIFYNYGYEVTGYVQAGFSKVSGVSDVPGYEGSDSESGATFNIGASSNLGLHGVELGLSIDHYNMASNETGFSINGVFPIHKDVSLSGKYSNIDGTDLYFAGVRYLF